MPPLVSIQDLHVYLGESHILQGISFDVPDGGVTALLGRNGVGKTTTLRALMGLVDRKGTIELAGDDIQSTRTHKIVRRGVGYVPEDRDVFSTLTVDENLRLAERDAEPRYDLVYDLFPELQTRGKQAAGTLSGGQQQMLAFGVHYALGLDGLGLLLVLLTVVLVPIVLVAAWNDAPTTSAKPWFAWALALEALSLVVFPATDVFLFYVVFEATLIPAYFLIGGFGRGKRVAPR